MRWRPSAGVLSGCLCVLLTACSVGAPYRRPDIAPPRQWRETPPQSEAPTPSVWPEAGWWRGFGSERLDQLIAEAERNNDDLAGAIARVQEADAEVRIAGAPLFPSLDLGADATRERASATGSGLLLAQALSNLIDNALKFSPRNGAIDVAVQRRSDGGVEVAVTDCKPGLRVVLSLPTPPMS